VNRKEVEALLYKLCVDLGFCLPPVEQDRLASDPPKDVRAFTDAVFSAEGLDPATADRHLYRQVRDVIAAALQRSIVAQESDA
jgi:hypothetical protein